MRKFSAFAALLALCACGGGGGGGTVPTTGSLPTTQYASVKISVQVPAGAGNRGSARPAYVSPATQSIGVSVDSGTTTYTNLSPTSPACSGSTTYPLNCSVTITASVGTHTLTFTTYDQPQSGTPQVPSGNVLSQNSIAGIAFATGSTPNIPVVLQGVPANVSVALTGTNAAIENGTLFFSRDATQQLNASFTVITTDAAGNLIVGPGAPSISVSLTPSPTYVAATVLQTNNQGAYSVHAAHYQSVDDTPGVLTITATAGGGGPAVSTGFKVFPTVNIKTFAGQYRNGGTTAGVGASATLSMPTTPYLLGNGAAGPLLMVTTPCSFTLVGSDATISYPSYSCSQTANENPFAAATSIGPSSVVYDVYDNPNCSLSSYDAATHVESQITAPSTCIDTANSAPGTASQPASSAAVEDLITGFGDINYGTTKSLYFLAFYNTLQKWYLRQYDPATQTLTYVGQADYGAATAGSFQPYGSQSPSTAMLESVGAVTSDSHVMYVYSTGCIVALDPIALTQSVVAGQCGNETELDGVGTAAGLQGVTAMTVAGNVLYFTEDFSNAFNTDSLRELDLATGRVTTLSRFQVMNAAGHRRPAGTATRSGAPRAQSGTSGDYLSAGDDYGPNVLWPYGRALQYVPSRNSLLFPDSSAETIREVIL